MQIDWWCGSVLVDWYPYIFCGDQNRIRISTLINVIFDCIQESPKLCSTIIPVCQQIWIYCDRMVNGNGLGINSFFIYDSSIIKGFLLMFKVRVKGQGHMSYVKVSCNILAMEIKNLSILAVK